MDFRFDDREEAFRCDVRALMAEVSPSAEVRRLMGSTPGYDPATWDRLAGDLRLTGLAIPTPLGGSGLGFVELAIAMEEMGAALLCAPFLSTVVLAAAAIVHSGDDETACDLLPRIAAGRVVASLAFSDDGGGWNGAAAAATLAHHDGASGCWRLEGHRSFVIDGDVAEVLLVSATTGSGPSLFVVEADAPGLARTPLRTVDQTRRQARLCFEGTPARLLGREGGGQAVLSRVLDLAAVALACEQVGGARRCLEMAVDHARARVQFGRPIGSFQAVKHKCAEMLLEVETARSAAYYGAWAAARLTGELAVAASVAKARCSDAYARVAADNLQVHGGVGFTWDHDAHLYYRRARSSRQLLGDALHHREEVARRIRL